MNRSLRFCLGLLIVLACIPHLAAGSVDQSQKVSEKENDWDEGDAQTFTAGESGLLKAIRLPVFRKKGECGLKLELRHVDVDQAPTGPVLATAFLEGGAFEAWTLKWYSIPFDEPYEQTADEKLCFVLRYVDSGKEYGWLCISGSTNNPYADGLLYYPYSYGREHWAYTEGYVDLAFETIITARPELKLSKTNKEKIKVGLDKASSNCTYRLQFSSNLYSDVWTDVAVTNGVSDNFQWEDIPLGPGDHGFYRISVEEGAE